MSGRLLLRHVGERPAHLLQADRAVVGGVRIGFDGAEDGVGIEGDLAVEKRAADHVRGEPPGLLQHLERSATLRELRPLLHLLVERDEEVGDVLGIDVGMEVGLLRLAHLLPQRAVDRDHRVAEDRFQPVEIFHVVVDVVDEDAAGVLDLAQDIDLLGAEIDRNATAVALAQADEDCHRIVGFDEGLDLEPDALLLTQRLRIGVRFTRHDRSPLDTIANPRVSFEGKRRTALDAPQTRERELPHSSTRHASSPRARRRSSTGQLTEL